MRNVYFAIIILITLIVIFFAKDTFKTTTGFGIISMLNVLVQEKINGKILLSFEPLIEIGKHQNIYVEFINTGTNPVNERIEVRVYGYINGTLRPLANYYDIFAFLNPGERKSFKTVFLPPNVGLYYIQAKASFDTRVVEVWGAFSVQSPPPQIIPIYKPIFQPPPPPAPIPGVPDLSLDYPNLVKFYAGEKKLINISVKNVGTAPAYNIKLYISISSLINTSISPKQFSALNPNEKLIFLVLVEIPYSIEEGMYPIDFEVISDGAIKRQGKISLQVMKIPTFEEEDIYSKILNYEFLISEIFYQINNASLQGYDVGFANKTLNLNILKLKNAKDYLKLNRIDDAKRELREVEKGIQDALLQFASSTLYIYKPTAIYWWLIVLIILSIALAVLAYWYSRRERRPRLLRKTEEMEK